MMMFQLAFQMTINMPCVNKQQFYWFSEIYFCAICFQKREFNSSLSCLVSYKSHKYIFNIHAKKFLWARRLA